METQRHTMPTVYRMVIKPTRSETRGRFRVTLFAKEGTYALSVPQMSFSKLIYRIVKQRPLTINFGRTTAMSLNLNIKGIKPLGKTARKEITYTPLRLNKKKKKTTKTKNTTETQTKTQPPKIPEVTPPVFDKKLDADTTATSTDRNKGKGGKTKTGKNRKAITA
jgi:hypothetical protein